MPVFFALSTGGPFVLSPYPLKSPKLFPFPSDPFLFLINVTPTGSKAHGNSTSSTDSSGPTLPLSNPPTHTQYHNTATSALYDANNIPRNNSVHNGLNNQRSNPTSNNVADNTSNVHPPPAPPPQVDGERNIIESTENEKPKKKNVATRFWFTGKHIILSSYINILLVFVPVGIVAYAIDLSPGIIFAMNAIAIIPLAGLLSHATESVAKRMGDTIGALMNVTFGNAVELIIFMYVYLIRDQDKKNEIRIVQASLLGSILANLLLILGMCFLVGGLRFREQIYNSTVTQMSACLLSLSVMSLLLPTAFHASFNTTTAENKANTRVLQVSRGTSVVLLLVYAMYLLFQLKSHAYMYESTPQHIIDEESAPGPVAAWMDSSSDDSSSSSSDSDGSSGSNTTAKRVKRLIRGGRRRKSSSASKDTVDVEALRTPSFGNGSINHAVEGRGSTGDDHRTGAIDLAEDGDDERPRRSRNGSFTNYVMTRKEHKKERKLQKKEKKARKKATRHQQTINEGVVPDVVNEKAAAAEQNDSDPRRVDFAMMENSEAQQDNKRPFTLRGITSNIRPQIPKTFSQNVFTNPAPTGTPPPGNIPRVRMGIRRTNSLPDRLNQTMSHPAGAPANLAPIRITSTAVAVNKVPMDNEDENISRTTAIVLLLLSTGLVAVCAEFMVDSINAVVASNSGLSEAFIGLIILPIVGNAAEHVTAVTVASKNKMDLAIGVAVGSSIQIALFVTPFIVLLGWCMSKEMTLYFTLFETVCLFVSAFIVNFLVLDGRSNYLEGALLCAAYVIIAVAAFFYPSTEDQSNLGGNADAAKMMVRSLMGI
ncbi:hypothetical protein SS1G_12337 [Sclerotinia sclerotiorum 1980 UF-70]|uniref:Sodium/calcium exchanger membrane region domain-containing protein n=1 Tax=Sclerotinia sclerotiorum (strain ATCC 18683 / 1980 / Ss-1) TaxID=665079 RepID=A7F339_SCLS1|nr:hypothetical protein SS1G_12337 [Sclerotinia sclerotiorum 1980 UF-70]EDN96131.1 hypothetical protein SS1G_12337 [Sclerotinia sclerotiorum 1980 UF-70]